MAELVDRRAELSRVDAALGRPGFSAVLVDGEAGIGKSALLAAVCADAARRGWRVLACRACPAEATLSFAALSDLLAPLPPAHLRALPEPQRAALAVALLEAPPSTGIPDLRAIATGVLNLLRRLASEGPVLVAVDDLRCLDSATADVLGFACRRLQGEAVKLVLTQRSGAQPGRLAAAARAASLETLRLGPLPLGSLGSVLGAHLGAVPPRPVLVRIHEACAGNPLYAIEIARRLGRDHDTARHGPLPLPESLEALIGARVEALPGATRHVLLEAAVLRLPALEHLDVSALAPAEEAGLVQIGPRGVEFAHPLIAAAVQALATPTMVRELHRVAASVVGDAEERARHLALGTVCPDSMVAAEIAGAAAIARARGATVAAAELGEDALRLTPRAAEERAERLLAAARYHFDAGDFGRADGLLEELLAQAGAAGRSAALQLLALVRSRTVGFVEARRLALLALEAATAPDCRAGIALDAAFYAVSLGDLGAALDAARAALASVEGHADSLTAAPALAAAAATGPERPVGGAKTAEMGEGSALEAATLAVATMVEFLAGNGVDERRLRRALALEAGGAALALVTRPRYIEALLLLWTGRLGPARAALESVLADIVDAGEESSLPLVSLFLVWALLWSGEVPLAASVAGSALEAALVAGDPGSRAVSLTASALVHAYDGQGALAEEEGHEALSLFEAVGWWSAVAWTRWAMALAALGEGAVDRVDAYLGSFAESILGMGFGDPVLFVFVSDEVDALVALGQLARATELVELLEAGGRSLDRPWALAAATRGRGEIAAAAGNLDEAIACFEQAIVEHERAGMPIERARTLLELGKTLRRAKRRAAARRVLEEAESVFESCGVPRFAERASSELARLGSPAPAGDELSATERLVAELAAADLANRQVAERAFLSLKAVEANLTRAYRKLGVRSRAGLAAALASGAERGATTPQTRPAARGEAAGKRRVSGGGASRS